MSDNWYVQHGICTSCKKNRVAPGKKSCFDCLDKRAEYNEQHREQRKQYRDMHREETLQKNRAEYHRRKECGLCVRCGKMANYGIYCHEHYLLNKRYSQRKIDRRKTLNAERGGTQREKWIEAGLCWSCGQTCKSGSKLCEKHCNLLAQAAEKGREKLRKAWQF